MHWLWAWGIGGAFMLAGNRFLACILRKDGGPRWACFAELAFSLGIGAFGAASFSTFAEDLIGQHGKAHTNAIAAIIGLLINPLAPVIVDTASGLVAAVKTGWLVKLLKGEFKS